MKLINIINREKADSIINEVNKLDENHLIMKREKIRGDRPT